VHFFLIVLVYNLAPMLEALPGIPSAELLTTLMQMAVVLLLWGLVRKRVLFGFVPN
jgi:hypothetical protein